MPQEVAFKEGSSSKIRINQIDHLLGLVEWGALELRVSAAVGQFPNHPIRLGFRVSGDEETSSEDVLTVMKVMKKELDEKKLQSFAKSGGENVFDVWVPLKEEHTWAQCNRFAVGIMKKVIDDLPEIDLSISEKSTKKGKIGLSSSSAKAPGWDTAPYSLLKEPGAHISTPLAWEDVLEGISQTELTMDTIRNRLASVQTNPWDSFEKKAQILH